MFVNKVLKVIGLVLGVTFLIFIFMMWTVTYIATSGLTGGV